MEQKSMVELSRSTLGRQVSKHQNSLVQKEKHNRAERVGVLARVEKVGILARAAKDGAKTRGKGQARPLVVAKGKVRAKAQGIALLQCGSATFLKTSLKRNWRRISGRQVRSNFTGSRAKHAQESLNMPPWRKSKLLFPCSMVRMSVERCCM